MEPVLSIPITHHVYIYTYFNFVVSITVIYHCLVCYLLDVFFFLDWYVKMADFSIKTNVKRPWLDNLDNNSCDWDERGIRLLSLEDKIVNKEIILKYYRNCKATYCSSYHINNYKKCLNKKIKSCWWQTVGNAAR